MSIPIILRVHGAQHVRGARLLEIGRADGEPLGFCGGQYVIVNTGLVLESGKLAKRAYSFLSSDAEQRRATLAIKRLGEKAGEGAGSNFLHAVAVGTELPYSGPWGKLRVDAEERALVVATDTGITAALGVLRSKSIAAAGKPVDLLWLASPSDPFLDAAFVKEALTCTSGTRNELRIETIAGVGDPSRIAQALAFVAHQAGTHRYDAVACAGDGAVIYPVRDALIAAGVAEGRVGLESFFNNPLKKSP